MCCAPATLCSRALDGGSTSGWSSNKALPIAAGLGGGSSDAAAALRLVRDTLGLPVDDQGLREIAGTLGADGPACLGATPVIGTGRGDRPGAGALVPFASGRPCQSGRRLPHRAGLPGLRRCGRSRRSQCATLAKGAGNRAQVAVFLAGCRNDLEGPAVALAPEIGECLEVLCAHPEPLLVRMSGSGATCFALCEDAASAAALAERLKAEHPHWWVRACVIGGR